MSGSGSRPTPAIGARAHGLPAPGRRILIVDDERDAAYSLALLLEARGHDVRTAMNGDAALEAARTFVAEIALIDLGLPGIDGYGLAPRLRELLPQATLVAVTGYQRDASRLEAAGFEHHLLKPIDMQLLTDLLAKAGPRYGD